MAEPTAVSPHQHFHDRASAHDPAVIKVMSFQRDDPKEWSGQTLLTADLIANAYTVVTEGLERTCDHLRVPHAGDARADTA